MEYKDFKTLIKKHPLPTFFTILGTIVPCTLAYFFLEDSAIDVSSIAGVIIFCLIFSFIPYALWAIVAHMTIKMAYKPVINGNQIEWDEFVNTKTFYLIVLGMVNGGYGILLIPVCLYFDLGIRSYVSLLILFPVCRLILTAMTYSRFRKRSNSTSNP